MKNPSPCSKCGERAVIANTKGIPIQYQIRCSNCQNMTGMYLSETEAIKKWNSSFKKSVGSSKFIG